MKFLIAASTCLAMLGALTAAGGGEPNMVQARPDAIRLSDVWVRAPVLPQRPAALYFTIQNSGTLTERLVGVRTPSAARAEMHNHLHEGGVMKMRKQDRVEIAPGQTLAFKPGGLHVMLFEPADTVAAGGTLTATLVFETAGEIEITAGIRSARGD